MTTKERLAQSCLIFQQAPFFILPLPEFIGVKLSKNYWETNTLKVIMRWKCEFLNRWLLARGWQSSIPHVWVERRKSCQYFPRHLCSSHFYNTFSAPANWEKLLHFPVFLEEKKFLIRNCSLKGRVLYNFLFFHRPRSEFGTVSSRNCDFTDGLKPLVKWLSPPLFSRFFVCSGEVPPPLIDLQFSLLKIGWDCQIFILPIYQYILPIIFILQTIFQVIYKIWVMSTNVPCHWWRRKFNEQ